MNDLATAVAYRKSATPGVPPATASQKRLQELRTCPLGRLVAQLDEIDAEIADIKGTNVASIMDSVATNQAMPAVSGFQTRPKFGPNRVAIAALMAVKFNVLKALLPYAYAQVPALKPEETPGDKLPLIINLHPDDVTREEHVLIENINEALTEARQVFPEYKG